ncbi:hypothetical protein [Marinobacter salarius]|uniref:Uncharacterized protein n=1 Tax=Marinobacter salarius TaxID=1420917 RepID=A0A1W6KFN5_9GAMM|nr:hypothetical protein [Marinobacter salarius]ARM86139.1 hypothetical protein MARSALSMR5_04119 [Marinobacter salarius]
MNDDEQKDLFENLEQLPPNMQRLIDKFNDEQERIDLYHACRRFLVKAQALGYTFEYGLDGEPYDLRELSEPISKAAEFKRNDHWTLVRTMDGNGEDHRFLVREATINQDGDLSLQFLENGNPRRPKWLTFDEERLSVLTVDYVPEDSERLREILLTQKPHTDTGTIPAIPYPYSLDLDDDFDEPGPSPG